MMTNTSKLSINLQRLQADFDALSQIGATPDGGVSRLALSNEDLQARNWFADRIEAAGFFVNDDEVGNLSGIYFCPENDARTLLMGSHLDTVPDGGRFDGAIGVLAGLECMRTLRDAGISLPFNLEVVDFTDEEGCWQSFFGSMGLTGILEDSHVNDSERDNAAFRTALYRAGIRHNEVQLARRDPAKIAAYLELHIEQSEQLAAAGCAIGIVNTIVGREGYRVTFLGEATHAATTIREKRRDALQGAAMFITRLHTQLPGNYPEGVVNCGSVKVHPGTFSIVPSEVTVQVECRHEDQKILLEMADRVLSLAQESAHAFHLEVRSTPALQRPAAPMSPRLNALVEDVCDDFNYSHMSLVSYAGHDAQILSPFTPSALIFVPSQGGISHNPREFTQWHQIEVGANVLLQTILRLAHAESE